MSDAYKGYGFPCTGLFEMSSNSHNLDRSGMRSVYDGPSAHMRATSNAIYGDRLSALGAGQIKAMGHSIEGMRNTPTHAQLKLEAAQKLAAEIRARKFPAVQRRVLDANSPEMNVPRVRGQDDPKEQDHG